MNITTYTRGDEVKIINLFKAVFGKDMNWAFWQWRFANNPIGKIMIRLMWDKEKLVGHYALSPIMLLINDNPVFTGLSMTTMTHPDYNGRGIFTSLAEELYQSECKQSELKAVWGFPNDNSHAGFIKKLQWINLPLVPSFSLLTDGWQKKYRLPDQLNTIETFTDEHERTYNYITSGFKVKVLKTISYLNWRYFQNPVFQYIVFELKHENYCFFAVTKLFLPKKGETELDIVEFIFPDNSDMINVLLDYLLLYYKEEKINQINLWLPLNDPRHLTLERMGFKNNLPITYMGVRAFDLQLSKELGKGENWYFSMGDSDVF